MLKAKLGSTDTRLVRVWLSIAAAMLATLLFAPAALADISASANWSGYAVHRAGISFRKVSASWKQPNASCSAGRPAYSAYWVGLGGFNPSSSALEQIGTETDCDAYGNPRLSAWYELVPSPSRPITMTVRPGDTINASAAVVGHRATLILNDLTRHTRFAQTFSATSIDVSSAEWIVEAPSECINISTCQTLPLANFGTARFTGATAQGAKGHLGTIAPAPWSNTKIVLTPSARRFVTFAGGSPSGGAALPSGLTAGGSAFTVMFSSQSNPFMKVRAAAPAGLVPLSRLYH